MGTQRIDAIDALLPQTQCTRCGYPDCRAYAAAIENESASYNQCPPGGQAGVRRLANLLGKPEIALNSDYGIEGPRTTAVIDEQRCIGCTLCIPACPVDAIMGSAKRMHTVLTAYCTGCDLCLVPCPVDCIDMIELRDFAARGSDAATQLLALSIDDVAAVARRRYDAHRLRNARQHNERTTRLSDPDDAASSTPKQATESANEDRKKAIIAAALERARVRRMETDRARQKKR